ncbi:hypothetical protein BC830DRAFT_788677, partial [Chytriomyces sp. MP71]
MQAPFDVTDNRFQIKQSSTFSRLGLSLTIDLASALATSAFVSPFVAIIDRSIIANASGRTPLLSGLKEGFRTLILQPSVFARQPSVVVVFGVYVATYLTANAIETVAISASTAPDMPKFIASSGVNIAVGVYKDQMLARWFGNGAPRAFPTTSCGLFALRDSLTIAASFSLPPVMSNVLHSTTSYSKATCDSVCQLALPCMIQFV